LSKEDITRILQDAGKDLVQRNAPLSESPKMTAEEFEKQFNVYKATKEFVAKLRSENPDEALAALHELRDGITRQNVSMNQVLIQAAIEKALQPILQQLGPINTHISGERERQAKETFFKDNPDLVQHESIVTLVRQAIDTKGWPNDVKTIPQALKHLAEETNKVLTNLQKSTTGAVSGNTGGRSNGAVKTTKMSQLSSGGQGGAGRTVGNVNGKVPSGVEVFQ
jgi:hypothetical protein